MKKTPLFAVLFATLSLGLAGCNGSSEPSEQDVADKVASSNAIVISSGTNKGLNLGASGSNKLVSSAYLYLSTAYITTINEVQYTTSIAWVVSDPADWTISAFDDSHEKAVPTYPAKGGTAISSTFTATVTYKGATATAVANVSLTPKTK